MRRIRGAGGGKSVAEVRGTAEPNIGALWQRVQAEWSNADGCSS